MPLGHEELYSDPDWPEYEAIAGPRASAEGFLQFKANKPPGASYPKGQNIGGPHDSTLEELMLTTPPGQQFAGQAPGQGVMERPGGGKRGGRGGSGGGPGGGVLRNPTLPLLAGDEELPSRIYQDDPSRYMVPVDVTQNVDPYGSIMDADANAMFEYAKSQNTQAASPLPEPQDDRAAVLMELLKKYGMERDYHGGNIRPTDFGDESEEFGDEGMNYPGRPDYYAPEGKGHTPVWHPSSELPPLSPELMEFQMTQNPRKAVPTERVPEDVSDALASDKLPANDPRYAGRVETLKGFYGPEYVSIMKKYGYPDDKGQTLGDFADSNIGALAADLMDKDDSPETRKQVMQLYDRWMQAYSNPTNQ